MQHISDKHCRRSGPGRLTWYFDRASVVLTSWRRLCMIMMLLCGSVAVAADHTGEHGANPTQILGDFNGDGRDDVLLRHTDGRWFYYPMDGRSYDTAGRGYANLTRNLDWRFAGIGDLNGDGKDDVLLRHTDGRWFYYPMDGRYHITSGRGLANLTPNLDWQFAGIGDLNGDGRDDVLLRHTDGRWWYYPMDGRYHITDERGLAGLTRNLDWHVAGIGDLNGDNRDDVLLRHTDGRWYYYPMDGRRFIADERGAADLTGDLDWRVAGIGDLNGDDRDDVLLRHTDGRWYYYPMDGRSHVAAESGLAGLTRNLDWRVAGIGDLNGDDRDDVLLRHTNNRWYYYPMDGRRFITAERGTASLSANSDWSIAAAGTLPAEPPTPPLGGGDDSVSPEMVSIPGGTFRMGDLSRDGSSYARPVHSVTVQAFRMGKYEVTFAQWDACVADGGCGGYRPHDEGWGRGNRPVINVSWDDARLFIDWLNARTGGHYRLPTEAEWEYAVRAGSTTKYSWGNYIGSNWANCWNCGSQWDNEQTAPVGSFRANAWGLHDMHGNVWEWVQDCWHDNYQGAPSDGSAWISKCNRGFDYNYERGERVIRGGSWNYSFVDLRSAYRGWNFRPRRGISRGFRLAQDNNGGGNPVGSDNHSDNHSDATALAPGGSVSGWIQPGNDVDYFVMHVSGSGALTLYTKGSLDTTGELQDSAGSVLANNDDGAGSGDDTNFRIEHSVSAGTYYVKVGSYQTRTGVYTLYAEFSGSGGGGGSAPDLTVDTPSVSNSSPNAGSSLTLSAVVRNRGNGAAAATTLRYYRSTDSTITTGDSAQGTDPVGALPASSESSESVSLTAPSNAGTYYYGACVDSVSGESDTGNNCSGGVWATVSDNSGGGPTTPPGGPSRDCADCPEMVSIPGGTFRMGDKNGEVGYYDKLPVHSVTVPAFRLGKYEVTFAQWDACVADGGCGVYRPPDYRGWGRGNRPVMRVSWDDARLFIDWLNARTGGHYRLPTEAEWEYAARAGTTTEYSWGNDIGSNRANCRNCGSQWDNEQTAPVGSFPANAWGLHDMHGNVWEWVQDCWHHNYQGAPSDGSAWISNCSGEDYNHERSVRVVRGGSWNDIAGYLRSAPRNWSYRSYRFNDYGFRVAQDN